VVHAEQLETAHVERRPAKQLVPDHSPGLVAKKRGLGTTLSDKTKSGTGGEEAWTLIHAEQL
jgi:hypothetical protein